LGYSADELIGKDFWMPIDPEFRDEMKKYAMALLHGLLIPGRFEIKFVRKNGETGWADMAIAPIRYRGRPAGVVTAMDITERKRAQFALAESEEKFRVLSELSPTAIFLYQGDKLIYANPAAIKFTGFSMGELLAKNFWDMVHPEYRELVKMYGLARQHGEPVPITYEVKYIAKGGQERWAEFTAGRIEYKGMPAGIVTAIDTTERKLADIELREAKRQAELYIDLMGHDINNMNQAALGFLEIVNERMALRQPTGVEEMELVANAMEALSRSTALIRTVQKLQKERSGGLKTEVIDVRRVLEDVRKQHAAVPGRDVTITFLPACRCHVLANELLKDVFSNIVGNAIKHSSGAIAIGIRLNTAEEHGRLFCRVAVEDTGPGIPDERKRAIFERAGKAGARLTGKGLGLYLVKTLVDDYHGSVWVEDRVPGDYRNGVRFVVMLPAVPRPGEDAAEGADACIG
jgi:PAS domain S-box-containing protein